MGHEAGARPRKFYDQGVERATLYLQKTAWLSAIPSGPLGKAGLTRRQLIGEDEATSQTPEPGPLCYLITALAKAGSCDVLPGFNGPFYHPLHWTDLSHWPGISDFLPCEAQSIRDLSAAYAQMLNNASVADDPVEILDDSEGATEPR